jgi:hypothetical protein
MSDAGTTSIRNQSGLGTVVRKTTADLFDGTTTSIFTVSGKVYITALIITVDAAALDATADNVKWTANPTTGTSVDLCANLDVANDEQGTIYSITGTLTDALVGTTAGAVAGQAQLVVVNSGTIDLVSSGDSNDGNGATQSVFLAYEPIDAGSSVVLV